MSITEAASAAIEAAGVEGVLLLVRHLHGDWGDVAQQDRLQNELAILLGLRVLSSYNLPDGERVWIITDADRHRTTVMLAGSYPDEKITDPAGATPTVRQFQ